MARDRHSGRPDEEMTVSWPTALVGARLRDVERASLRYQRSMPRLSLPGLPPLT